METKRERRIREAQEWTTMLISGKYYPRIPFGQESIEFESTGEKRCITCTVSRGQLHVLGCKESQCPACGAVEIQCLCESWNE